MLNALIFFPLFIALVVLLLDHRGARFFGVMASLAVLGLNFKIFLAFLDGLSFDERIFFQFFSFFTYHIGLDAFSIVLMLLCSLMIFLTLLFLKIEQKAIISSIFFLQWTMMGLFSAKDALLFYIFWELSLLPLLYILGVYGKDFRAGIKFFIYAFAGSVLMLIAMIYQAYLNYQVLGIFSFNLDLWKNNASVSSLSQQIVLFSLFFLAFAIKAPLFPLHTWAPRVYAHSPIVVSVMLVAFKMAPFGFVQFCLPLFPDASVYLAPFVMMLCIVSVVYCALIAFRVKNLKELIAYSSISHIGIMVLGIFSLNSLGISGAVFYMFAHGLVTGGLFLMAEILEQKYGSSRIDSLHSVAKNAPGFSIFFAILVLAGVSLPLTLSFVGEFLVLLALAKIHIIYALLAGLVVILSAIYMLYVFRKIFFMQTQNALSTFRLKTRQILALVPMVFLIFYLGIVPNFLLKPLEDESKNLQKIMHLRAVEKDTLDFLSQFGAYDE